GVEFRTRVLDGLTVPWRALFVGAGPLEAALRAWAAHHGDRARIRTGVVHDDVPPHLNAMDVLCAPSRTTPRWREQFGRMLVEAMAAGVPVVATDSGSLPEVIGDAGRIVPEHDSVALHRAIAAVLDDPADLGERGRRRARERY